MGKLSVYLKWHTLVIVACILLFSLLCWLELARAAVSKVSKELAREDSVIGTSDGLAVSKDDSVIGTSDGLVVTKEDSAIGTSDGLVVTKEDSAIGTSYALAVTKDDSDEIVKSDSDTINDYAALMNQYIHIFDGEWNDHIFLRGKISAFDSMLTYYVTGEICSAQVLLGKENWLFYKSTSDGNPIADYEGTNKHSEVELQQMLHEISRVQDVVEDTGARFVVVIPPNKENIYADYMPDIYQHAEPSRTDILVDYLEKDVNIIFPKQQLLDSHMDMQLYYKYDTHWNQLGAYICVKQVLDAWGIELPELSQREIKSTKLGDCDSGGDDLARMLGLTSIFDDRVEYEVVGAGIKDWGSYVDEQTNGEISRFVNERAISSRTVFLIGDSFRIAMLPALREAYSEVYVIDRNSYKTGMLAEIRPDDVIVEYAERYSAQVREISSILVP